MYYTWQELRDITTETVRQVRIIEATLEADGGPELRDSLDLLRDIHRNCAIVAATYARIIRTLERIKG